MKKSTAVVATTLAAASILAGCASPNSGYYPTPQSNSGYYPAPQSNNYPANSAGTYRAAYGVVDAIEVTNTPQSGIGAGTVIGGIVGGILGNQIGGGTGNTVATVAGAVGGAVAGNQIEKRTNRPAAYNVRVRMKTAATKPTQDNVADLRVGDRVRLENGRVYRY